MLANYNHVQCILFSPGVPHDRLVGLCESYFSAIPAGNAAVNEKPNYVGGTIFFLA